MAPVILITFAGRRNRMEILTNYVQAALAAGIIDEWHVWDFTGSEEDRVWVSENFGPARFMHPDTPYVSAGQVTPMAPFRMDAGIAADLHLALLPKSDPDNFYEFVIGGWNNQLSAVRKMPRVELATFARDHVPRMADFSTPGILSPSLPNSVVMSIDRNGHPVLTANGMKIGPIADVDVSSGADVMVRGGWGADLEILNVNDKVRRYIGPRNEKYPYHHTYAYYSKYANRFSDAIFLKCDDDIVYMNLDRLGDFINFRRDNPTPFLVSANVVNNGVCAHWQQRSGSLPIEVGHFEMPPGGLNGSLWESGKRANALHDYFLQTPDKRLPLHQPFIEVKERVSINFISWLGQDLKHFGFRRLGDEKALAVDMPRLLNRPVAIYSDFIVSHLSFGPQEAELHVDRLVSAYSDLMREQLAA